MELQELIFFYQKERQQKGVYEWIVRLCQLLYIRGDIDVSSYRRLLEDLYEEGATSSHEMVSTS